MSKLGEILRTQREKRGITLDQAAADTRIREKFLKALEDGDYMSLPGAVYTTGFLRNYAEYLDLNQDELVVLFHQERGLTAPEPARRFEPIKPIIKRPLIFTPAVLVPVAVLAAVLLFVGYLYYQFTSFAVALTLDEPQNGARYENTYVSIVGRTEPSVNSVVVNGATVPVSSGHFEARFFFPAGPTEITVIAQNAVGSVTLKRQVSVVYTSAVVQVFVKGGEAWIQATVDGTIAAGTGRLYKDGETATFTGKTVAIRSGNAAATQVTYNGVYQGTMGQQGQIAQKVYTAQ